MKDNIICSENFIKENDLFGKNFKSNPTNINFSNSTLEFKDFKWENEVLVFLSINKIFYLIYSNRKNKSLISYDIINNKKINEVKNPHGKSIIYFKYYFDKINKRDLIISSYKFKKDCNIKIWNAYNFECLYNLLITNNGNGNNLFSFCLLNENVNNYIVASYINYEEKASPIKIFDFNGKEIKEIKNSNEYTLFVDTYYDNKSSKIYIITCNKGNVISYDYNENRIYHKYCDINDNLEHFYFDINNKDEIIETCMNGYIRIWNFHLGKLLRKIKIDNELLINICLWNNEFLLSPVGEKLLLIDLNSGEIIKEINNNSTNKDKIFFIKKIIHPKFGECLISQNVKGITIWRNNN